MNTGNNNIPNNCVRIEIMSVGTEEILHKKDLTFVDVMDVIYIIKGKNK